MTEVESFRQISFEKELARAKWFKEDLQNGGWKEIYNNTGSQYWMKTFREEKIPVKVLFTFDMPMPAEAFVKLLHPSMQETRLKWDKAFVKHQVLETFPNNEGYVTYMVTETSWPLQDREFVLFIPPAQKVNWFGEEAFMILQRNAWHASKSTSFFGPVRAENGGNYFIVIPDKEEPDKKCHTFALTNNNYNGILPNNGFESLISRAIPKTFNVWRESLIEGYENYLKLE
ncbi:uncharacterized protein LOC130655631 [Hydractinia symbiolongicarpus]|uniref:uncharacterized protein LOC130655631 n=1 Tax=Hydractinia symbiolongicarpus TaxID=13093 RepID=UPI00254A1530|nr:uncharacterized protein LOC130655631 [Hydractinia symbiolongicarpus]